MNQSNTQTHPTIAQGSEKNLLQKTAYHLFQTKELCHTMPLRLSLAVVMWPHGAQKLFGVLGGFDPEGISQAFSLSSDEIPVMLITVGKAAQGNWPQKIRRPVSEVLRLR